MTPLRRLIVWPMILSLGAAAAAADWPQFRGPGAMGIAAKEKGVPTKWDDDTNVAWKVELPGPGASSPIVVGDRVLVTCYSGYGLPKVQAGDIANLKRHLLCFSRAGKPLWKKEVTARGKEAPYTGGFITKHGYASSTPASDGKHVYVFFGTTGVLAFDLDGNELWRKSVGAGTNDWGSGTSPILHKNLVIVNAAVESESLVALSKEKGDVVWTAPGISYSWVTPVLVDTGSRSELVVSMYQKVRAFDPAKGTELWSCRGINDYVCSSIVAAAGVVYAIGGREGNAIAVKAGGKGEVDELWRVHKGSNVSSPALHDGYLYWTHEQNGSAYCVDAKNGKLRYTERLQPEPGLIYASPTLADGKLYYVSREQGIYVVDASPTFKLLAHNRFKSDTSVFNASPAIVDGKIYLRSDRFLYCIGK